MTLGDVGRPPRKGAHGVAALEEPPHDVSACAARGTYDEDFHGASSETWDG